MQFEELRGPQALRLFYEKRIDIRVAACGATA